MGDQDFIVPPAIVARLAAAIPGSEFEQVAGAGRVLHVEHGDWLAGTITGFLRKEG